MTMRLTIVSFLLAAVFGSFHALAQAQQQVAYIINSKGDWILNSSQSINPGSPLPERGVIKLKNRKGGEFIEIADRGGRAIISRRCDIEDCNQPIHIPGARDSVVSRLFSAVMIILGRDPDQFTVLISRGAELRESVVAVADGQADLTSIFAGVSRGTYLLRLTPKGTTKAATSPLLGPVIEWIPGKLCIVTIKGLNPGLYEVQLLGNKDREPLEPGAEAWVLFVKPEKFGDLFCDFHEAQLITEGWPQAPSGHDAVSIRQGTKRQFLRATLRKLEQQ